jgi:hypothetical protein
MSAPVRWVDIEVTLATLRDQVGDYARQHNPTIPQSPAELEAVFDDLAQVVHEIDEHIKLQPGPYDACTDEVKAAWHELCNRRARIDSRLVDYALARRAAKVSP